MTRGRLVSWAVALTRGWTLFYTSLAGEDGAERRAEVESDLFEHCRDLADTRTGQLAAAGQLITRCLQGTPADVVWRLGCTGMATRGALGLTGVLVFVVAIWWVPLMRADVLPVPPRVDAFVAAPPPPPPSRVGRVSPDRGLD